MTDSPNMNTDIQHTRVIEASAALDRLSDGQLQGILDQASYLKLDMKHVALVQVEQMRRRNELNRRKGGRGMCPGCRGEGGLAETCSKCGGTGWY